MNKYILAIIIFFILINISNVSYAFVPPVGCEADSYIAYKDSSGNLYARFYQGTTLKCTANYGSFSFYTMVDVGDVPMSMSSTAYNFFIGMCGIICALVFVLGLRQ
jgi:hypothetical protein